MVNHGTPNPGMKVQILPRLPMKHAVIFVDIQKLIRHERVNRARCVEIRKQICLTGIIRRPVIVDKASNVILDGHHRVEALRELGAKRVPVAYVNYSDNRVRVYLRRKDMMMKLVKRFVVEMANVHDVFPSKTTRHLIHGRPTMKPVHVSELMK